MHQKTPFALLNRVFALCAILLLLKLTVAYSEIFDQLGLFVHPALAVFEIKLPRQIGAGTLELTIHYREILMACFPRGHRPAAMNVFCPGVLSQ